ncbi:fumarate hydratase C-terminal domain-containing protein [Amphritea sp. 2_MG-2023]|uniref:fumarate hydratase C-terminal domain-containing protein n=1 Tax=Amphritea TaxID=515417 RepID=UPI001C0656BF|nr:MULTISPECIES: fumarate hydratase C-terminal domain-containing protein [Amphritea]MBU2966755.1 fumarate hydratase C-terminal domain-containing protein [Amphritea atlantica]MDO6418978.1 fumarate hydratase C-terminal domain-containing protein [Amphritea sp. 2_MG-2023]
MSKMNVVKLKVPVSQEDVDKLEQGDIVYLTGTIYTAREGVYKKVLESGEKLPVDIRSISNVNFHCSPAASPNEQGGYDVGAVTATASFRFGKWMKQWFEVSGAKIIIGKGGMPEQAYRDVFVPNGARYLSTVGYGAGALLGRGIKQVKDVHWLAENGIAQAMWIFEVDEIGPFIVDNDREGNSLFVKHENAVNAKLEKLYEGLKPPALKRYGETTSRADEVIGEPDTQPIRIVNAMPTERSKD